MNEKMSVKSIAFAGIIAAAYVALTLLFDPDHGLSERIIAEQFTV